MKKRLKVLIHGDTLVLGCLRASLASYEGLELASFEDPVTGLQELAVLGPDVIICDLEAIQPAIQYSLAVQSLDLMIFGVDSASNRVLAWSGRQLCQLSTAELVQVIERAKEGRSPVQTQAVEQRTGDDNLRNMLELLGLALADEEFRAQVSADPQTAARSLGMTLSQEEAAALKASDLTKMAEGLDERLSKSFFRSRPSW